VTNIPACADASKSVCEMLGGARRPHVPLYANINRRTVKRTPTAFAQSAIDAASASAFKIAPL
jgi:L-alanine-DL-glutamate epimerase-like enolase superfamily enzyme